METEINICVCIARIIKLVYYTLVTSACIKYLF